MAYSLSVNWANKKVGVLVVNKDTGLLSLKYNDEWRNNGFAISPALSLDNKHTPASVYNYLDNALPEGDARRLLAQDLGVSEKNVYSQVNALGRDLSGAITFGENYTQTGQQPKFRLITEDELIQRLNRKDEFGLLHWDEKPRLSVAGVQDKLNVFINNKGQMGFGDGSLCSTHILKFEKNTCPNLVINEYFCMKLSAAIGLPTAEVEFRRFELHPALIVRRFDRKFVAQSQRVLRRHVIDGCQALNLPRDFKYERNFGDSRDVKHIRDGASLIKLFEFCQQTSAPVAAMQWLINWQLFNLMINNFDSHGKNVSFYYGNSSAQFTPAYDLVNVAMFNQFKQVLAMAMGDEFEPHDIHAYQLADFAESCKLDKKLVSSMLIRLADKVLKQLHKNQIIATFAATHTLNSAEMDYLDALSANIKQRTRYLRSQAKDMLTIAV